MSKPFFSVGLIIGLGLVILVLAAPALSQSQDSSTLIRIGLNEPDDLTHIEALGLPVLAHLTTPGDDYLLVVLDARNQNHVQSLGLTYSVLDSDANEATYYVIESEHPRLAERVDPSDRLWSTFAILYDNGRQAVGRLREKVSPLDVDSLGISVARLGIDGDLVQLAPRTVGAIPTTPLHDPLVADLLARVTTDEVSGYAGGISGEWPVSIGGQAYSIATRYSYSGEPIAKATQYVYEHMQTLGYDVSYHNFDLSGYALRNVVGEKRGLVHPDQIFLLSAHLDSRAVVSPHNPAPGADDNASGSTALLVVADLLADLDLAYTIRIVFFTGEEQGMYGSYYYARDAANAGEDILGVLNLDMIAWDAEGGPDIDLHSHLPGIEDDSDALADLFTAVVDVYDLGLDPQIVESGAVFSDHSRFWDRGYAAILAIEDYYNVDEYPAEPRDWNTNYHTVNDRLSTLNLTYFCEYVRASLATFAHLAEPMRILGGTVTDASIAAPVNSATVVAVGQNGAFNDTVDGSGGYEIVLPTGIYKVTVSAEGYYSQVLASVTILTGTSTILDFALESIIPPPPYDFNLVGPNIRFGKPGERVTHTITIANVGAQSDTYDLAFGSSAWTTTLPFTRSIVISLQQQITVPLTVTIPPDATRGDQDQITLTVTSVYSSVHTDRIALRTAVGHPSYLPLMSRNFPTSGSQSCVEVVTNGGFEDDGGWDIPVTEYSAGYSIAVVHSGDRSMRVGIVEPPDNIYSYSAARQTVTIPADVISATLRFWLYPITGESPDNLSISFRPLVATIEQATLASDWQYVLVLDGNGQQIRTLVWQRTDDQQWTSHEFDMGVHAGQTIKLQFGVYNDGVDGVTGIYVDDVSLEIAVIGSLWRKGDEG
ncbi:MAG: M28 family peptidase [Chloroflexi bacterium]|nr:M28 family peptidase [Chloroflexota bacterium]